MMILHLRSGRLRFAASWQWIPFLIVPLWLASACSPASAPTPFIPPTAPAPLIEPTFIINPTQNVTVIQSTPLPTILPTTNPEDCVNSLTFIEDLTIPDNSFITYGATIDKQWRVENSGTCNWNLDYRLRHIGGGALGAPEEIALFPARAGSQAILQITFTAPFTDGEYESAWQTFDPFGLAFGDPIYMRIIVAAP
ncbi:MAG TPA: NBR1-Ig-like domain-containing protein [Anaerolineales bacterium]|nr:NBR1-Ig-like domain-containing protein [Anaerolineales bacterium]